jgi:hypothetical protein
MKHPSWFLLAALGLIAPQLSAETLSLCVKPNGAARFAERCNPKKETQQFVTTAPTRETGAETETSNVRAITRQHTFPPGYLVDRDGWVAGPLCAENEVLVSGGAELPVFADGLAIYCEAAPAQPEYGSPVSVQCSSYSLQDDETGGLYIPLTQAVEVYLSSLCAKK